MFSKFFIDRPIFAAVLSIIVTLAGFLADRIAEVPEAERCAGFLRDSSAEAADLLLPASPV